MEIQITKLATRFGIDDTDETALSEFKKLCVELPPTEIPGKASVIEQDERFPEIGSWYWVPPAEVPPGRIIRNNEQWLGCVMEQGSNYVEIQEPHREHASARSARVHVNELSTLILEPNAKEYFQSKVEACRTRINTILGEIKDITARLGIVERDALPDTQDTNSMALAVVSAQDNVAEYKASLIVAKDKQLPDLFKEIEFQNSQLAKWMSAEILPIKASSLGMDKCLVEISSRIENIGLYAGLTENVELVKDGTVAASGTVLHLMQTRLYMDEECLVNYRHGGMQITDIGMFDDWLSEDENMTRLLPFQRCMVSFRVRRNKKKRANYDLTSMFINVRLELLDEMTFLYIRNGEKLYRMNCDFDFGENLFPDRAMFHPAEARMFNPSSAIEVRTSSLKMMAVSEYEHLMEKQIRNFVAHKTWNHFHGADIGYMDSDGHTNELVMEGKHVRYKIRYWSNPFRDSDTDRLSGWTPFDSRSVYYDDACRCVETQMKLYNRVVLIIQGLFDRSEVLHPHPRVKLWQQDGFEAAIKLVYDGDMVIEYGKPPSFAEYWESCNSKTDENSVMIGQEEIWETKEAEKECARIDRSWRESRNTRRPTHFRPYGNSGPGYLAHMYSFKPRSKKCTFTWMRDKLRDRYGDQIKTKITITLDKLFNASAYVPGDYKIFFNDPRTRRNYLKWAPLLLAAEEYHAGSKNARPQLPV